MHAMMRFVNPSLGLGARATRGVGGLVARSASDCRSHASRTLRPAGPDFSGWNWHAKTLPLRTVAKKTSWPYCVVVCAHCATSASSHSYAARKEWTK